jgi:hypothetical protein
MGIESLECPFLLYPLIASTSQYLPGQKKYVARPSQVYRAGPEDPHLHAGLEKDT